MALGLGQPPSGPPRLPRKLLSQPLFSCQLRGQGTQEGRQDRVWLTEKALKNI